MYVRFEKDTKRVVYVGDHRPLNTDDFHLVAECSGVPTGHFDYCTAENVTEQTEVTPIVVREEATNKEGHLIVVDKTIEQVRTYLTCDLVGRFTEKTEEQIARELQARYEALCLTYIRKKYSATDEYKVLREYLADETKKAQFDEYNAYVEACKARAKEEVQADENTDL